MGGAALWGLLPALVFFLPLGFTQSPAAGVLAQPPRADDILEKDSLTLWGYWENHMSWCVPCTYMGSQLAGPVSFCPLLTPEQPQAQSQPDPSLQLQEGMGRLGLLLSLGSGSGEWHPNSAFPIVQ